MLLFPGKTPKTILNWGGGISEKWRKTVKVAHCTLRGVVVVLKICGVKTV